MGIFIFSNLIKKKKMSSGLEAVSGNGFVGVSLYGIRIADWVSVSIGGWRMQCRSCIYFDKSLLLNEFISSLSLELLQIGEISL